MIESSLVLCGDTVIDISVGTPTTVEFNFLNIWNFIKQDSSVLEHIVFHHVHPTGMHNYSLTDKNCMEGFFIAFNIPIKFNIICFKRSDITCLKTIQTLYTYDTFGVGRMSTAHAYNNGLFLTDETLLKVLKLLSYNTGGVV